MNLIEQYKILHAKSPGYGRAATCLGEIRTLCRERGYKTIIDYGCGKGLLADKLEPEFSVQRYDPATFPDLPEPADFIVCMDVMEHLEASMHASSISDYERVLQHQASLSENIFYNISCRPAVHKLPNGMNCHTLVRSPEWWMEEIKKYFKIKGSRFHHENQNLILWT